MKPDDIPQWAMHKAMEAVAIAKGSKIEVAAEIVARALLDAHQRGRREGMEEAAKLVEGEVYYYPHYRTWPFWPEHKDGTRGNRSKDSELVKHCDQIAAAIRAKLGEVQK